MNRWSAVGVVVIAVIAGLVVVKRPGLGDDSLELPEGMSPAECYTETISHTGWPFGPSVSFERDSAGSKTSVRCLYWVNDPSDKKIEDEVISVCRQQLVEQDVCFGEHSRSFRKLAKTVVFEVSYSERPDERKAESPDFPDFTMTVKADVTIAEEGG